MKTPFPAYFFAATGNPFNSVLARPCEVLTLNEQSGAALIAVGSLGQSGRFEKWVSTQSLASSPAKAAKKFLDLLPALEVNAAAKTNLAGDGTGAGTSLPNSRDERRARNTTEPRALNP